MQAQEVALLPRQRVKLFNEVKELSEGYLVRGYVSEELGQLFYS